MKLNLYKAYSLIFTLLFLLVMVSCKTIKDIPLEEGGFLFENTTDDEIFFVKVDSVDDAFVYGKSYLFDDELIIEAEPFKIELFKRKTKILLSDSLVISYKIKRMTLEGCRGWFKIDGMKGKKQFSLMFYEIEEYQDVRDRYKDKMFEVERLSDITYANVKGYWSSIPDDTIDIGNIVKVGLFNSLKKKDLNLEMDIYIPKNDTVEKRPLIMFIHGGAFYIGDKATLPYRTLCNHFTSLGYVCVSINYRMGFKMSSKAIERTAYQATQDAHAAMRYLLSKKDIYRIDPDYLFVGGASAGSITAMNLAYMRNENRPKSSYSSLFAEDLGDLETSGNKLYGKFRVKGVVNMWGSVNDLKMLENSRIPIISFHGDKDEVVPYGQGYPFMALGDFKKVLFDEMYGSSCIHERALGLGIRSKLHTFSGEGHGLYLDTKRNLTDNFYVIQEEITDFFYDELMPHPVYIIQDEEDNQLFMIDTSNVATADWCVVGGVSMQETKGSIRASWFDDEELQELRVSGSYTNGAGFEDVFVIKNVKKYEGNTYE
ncbi:MAG: alpha/beta hydrolase [Bacteroidales bacterium]|nr:alpha/beta hydrolase [Bacteroidales bacterium]